MPYCRNNYNHKIDPNSIQIMIGTKRMMNKNKLIGNKT